MEEWLLLCITHQPVKRHHRLLALYVACRTLLAHPVIHLRYIAVKAACSRERLTLPSRGRLTAGFAVCKPPLMSNVRALVARKESIAVVAGRPRSGRRTCVVRQEVHLHRRPGLSVPRAGGQRTVGSKERNGCFFAAIQARENDLSHQRDLRTNASSTAPQSVRVRIEPQPSRSRVAEIKCKMQASLLWAAPPSMRPISTASRVKRFLGRATPKGVRRV